MAFLESRSYDPCEIIDELARKLRLQGHPGAGLAWRIWANFAGAIAQEKDLGVRASGLSPRSASATIAVHADIMGTRPTPGTSGRGSRRGWR
ncbi:MAG: hypothetical protein U0840_02025 [Gemmataceae bacterium]